MSSQAAAPSVNEDTSNPTRASFLRLPQEIRDRIYEELLTSYNCSMPYYKLHQKLEVAILRVNKAIHQQAMKTLYEKNCWAMINIDTALYRKIVPPSVRHGNSVNAGYAILRSSGEFLRGKVALSIDLRSLGHQSQADRTTLMVYEYSMQNFFRGFSKCGRLGPTRIDLRFWENAGARRHQAVILEYLKETRGLDLVTVSGVQPQSTGRDLEEDMRKPFVHVQEIIDRVQNYVTLADRAYKEGKYGTARSIANNGINFLRWYSDMKHQALLRLEGRNEKRIHELWELRSKSGFACARASIGLGDLRHAWEIIDRTMYELASDPRGITSHAAEALCCASMVLASRDADNIAVFCLLQALKVSPGHPRADLAVDGMEARLQGQVDVKDLIVKQNIERVLGPFRHQDRGQYPVSEDDYHDFFAAFTGTAGEINFVARAYQNWDMKDLWDYLRGWIAQ